MIVFVVTIDCMLLLFADLAALSARPSSTLLLTHVKYNVHFSRTRTLSD